MFRDLKYLIAFLIPIIGYVSIEQQGILTYSTMFYAFGIIPLLDILLPVNKKNIPKELESSKISNRFFDLLLYSSTPICYFIVYTYFQNIMFKDNMTYEIVGKTLSTGIVLGAMGINIAHELGHRTSIFETTLAKCNLLLSNYLHFNIEHNRGHHKNVSTWEDPASARRNEMVYTFFFRSIIFQYIHAWKLENQRMYNKGLSIVSIQNEMIQYTLIQILFYIVLIAIYGVQIVPYAIAIALISVLLLETINYIEHYGLTRSILPSGLPERVSPKHSWNSDHQIGRIVLFELTRHSDHHYQATRKYQILRHLEESPQLPLGYPGSMLLSFIPPLWFYVVNKRIQ